MQLIDLGDRQVRLSARIPARQDPLAWRVQSEGLDPLDAAAVANALKAFQHAVVAGLFPGGNVRPGQPVGSVPDTGRPGSANFGALTTGVAELVSARVLCNMTCQVLSPGPAPVAEIALSGDAESSGDTVHEGDILATPFPEEFDAFDFPVVFGTNGPGRDPVIRIEFRSEASTAAYQEVLDVIRAWDAVIAYGGFTDPSEQRLALRPRAPEVYLVTPTIIEHPVFGFVQSIGGFHALCEVLARRTQSIQSIAAIEVQ